jgi:plasmid maintenance system antidote protein VapI
MKPHEWFRFCLSRRFPKQRDAARALRISEAYLSRLYSGSHRITPAIAIRAEILCSMQTDKLAWRLQEEYFAEDFHAAELVERGYTTSYGSIGLKGLAS